jgi:alcohol dehydrogenase class IV
MALASTYAGLAFTRAGVGYVHAVAHQFGARYRTPHGLANAIMLPYVLRYSAPNAMKKYADLAVRAKLGKESESTEKLANKFMDSVEKLIKDLDIPSFLKDLKEEDIPDIAKAACWEAHTGYPVPRYMTQEACEEVIRQALPR